jgi:hypothetical protein
VIFAVFSISVFLPIIFDGFREKKNSGKKIEKTSSAAEM